MRTRNPITIHNQTFSCKTRLERHCRTLTSSLEVILRSVGTSAYQPRYLPAEQRPFWNDLYRHSPSTERKRAELGDELELGLAYARSRLKRNRVEVAIGLLGSGGTFVPVSWHECIAEAFRPAGKAQSASEIRQAIKREMRKAVRPQIEAYRRQHTVNGQLRCAGYDRLFESGVIDIDHHPVSFNELAENFLMWFEEEGIGPVLSPVPGEPEHYPAARERLMAVWSAYHEKHATLRPLHRYLNLTKPR